MSRTGSKACFWAPQKIEIAMRSTFVLGCVLLSWLDGDLTLRAESPPLTMRGQVVLPDGAPAAEVQVLVVTAGQWRYETRTDLQGRFQVSMLFDGHTKLIARSRDGRWQGYVAVPDLHARGLATKSLRITLVKAWPVPVKATRNGQPVKNAQVCINVGPRKPIRTDAEGHALLLLPRMRGRFYVSAWHPEFGVSGALLEFHGENRSPQRVKLTFHEPQPQRIRVVDSHGRPVPGFEVIPNFKPIDANFFRGWEFAQLRAVTDVAGEVEFAWAPKRLASLDVENSSPEWLVEDIAQPNVAEREPAIVRVRRKQIVTGRVIVPSGCDPTGLLIRAQSFGPGNRIDVTATRVRGDGRFSLAIAPEHCYALAICDRDWTSAPATGVLARSESEPKSLELHVAPSTPLKIRATIGSQRRPMQQTGLSIERLIEMEWKDADGEHRLGEGSLRHWMITDAAGTIRTGIGRGTYRIRIAHENWHEERILKVASAGPLEVAFHKPYEGRREIRGQLIFESGLRSDFSDIKLLAVESTRSKDNTSVVEIDAEGRFVFQTLCQTVNFFALDATHSLCGAATAGETDRSVTISLKPTSRYEGQLVDGVGNPIAGAELLLSLQTAPGVFVRTCRTDGSGRFQFDHVLIEQRLRLIAKIAGEQHFLEEHYFERGDNRQGIRIRAPLGNEELPQRPVHERVNAAIRDARLARLHALVILRNDNEESLQLSQELYYADEDLAEAVKYYPLALSTESMRANPDDWAFVERKGWPLPKEHFVTLIALDATGVTLGTAQIAANAQTTTAEVQTFLKAHRPQPVDPRALWQAALEDARQSNRRVLLQIGGPRCGPCFRLSRWTHDHHQDLERDYVLLKLHLGGGADSQAIWDKLPASAGGSIPWMAILDAEGRVLATSDGPLGNIGFPQAFEGRRHFRRMLEATAQRLTADEIAALVETLRE